MVMGTECMHVIVNGDPLEEVDCFKYLQPMDYVEGIWYTE